MKKMDADQRAVYVNEYVQTAMMELDDLSAGLCFGPLDPSDAEQMGVAFFEKLAARCAEQAKELKEHAEDYGTKSYVDYDGTTKEA